MATFAGKNGLVRVGPNPDDVGEVTSWNLTTTPRPQATRKLSSEWDTFKSGADVPKGWEGTVSAWWDSADAGQALLVAGDEVALTLDPSGSVIGQDTYTGNVIVTGVAQSVEDEGITSVEFSFLGNGPLTATPNV